MDPANRQHQVLNLEIRQLERRKTELTDSLERLDVSHKQAFDQHNQQIKGLTKTRDQLTEKIEGLRTFYETLTSNYEQAKKDLQEYKDRELKDANTRLESIRTLSSTIEQKALDKQTAADEYKLAVERKETQLDQWAKTIQQEYDKFIGSKQAFEEIRNEWYRTDSQREEEFKQFSIKLVKLKEEVQELETIQSRQKQEIDAANLRSQLREQDFRERVTALEIREKANGNLKTLLDKQKKDQEDENIRIRDRQGQLQRAIEEWRAKGVTT